MNSNGGGGGRYHRKPPYSDRLLSIFSTSTSASTTTGDELTEHDIFDAPSDVSSIPSTSSFPNPNPNCSPNNNHRKHFGILAALPESESQAPPPASTLLSVSSSSSSSSSMSSARLIPTVPKRPPPPVMDRGKYLQSAPVNVPVMSPARQIGRLFDDIDDVDVDGGEMLPPHELVASRQTPILASSVLEGAGRKLKGRDLRQVRNAIWLQTGFLD